MLRAVQTTWKSDTGRQRRDNEDSAFARAPIFVVADGMGGAQAGEVASKLAVEAFQRELSQAGTPEERLVECTQDANRRIYEMSRSEPERAGMGTTLTAVYLADFDLVVAHVGDSRAYLFRDGALSRLTQDHSLVEELVRRGKLTEEQAAEHPQRSIITRALGIDPEVEVDTWTYPARAGDVVLLCSDGLTSMIGEAQIAAVLAGESDLERAAERLIAEANEAGGRDNITVVLFRLEEVAGAIEADPPTVVGLESSGAGGDPDLRPAAAASPGPGASTRTRTSAATITSAPPARVRQPAPPQGLIGAGPPPTGGPAARRPAALATPATRRVRRGPRRFAKPLAALLAVMIVLVLVGGGGYLATRQLFFLGTNSQGILTIYDGLPYDLPLGVHLYEQFYVSGVPVAFVPASRRTQLLNHQLRSQADATNLVHAVELGQLSR